MAWGQPSVEEGMQLYTTDVYIWSHCARIQCTLHMCKNRALNAINGIAWGQQASGQGGATACMTLDVFAMALG